MMQPARGDPPAVPPRGHRSGRPERGGGGRRHAASAGPAGDPRGRLRGRLPGVRPRRAADRRRAVIRAAALAAQRQPHHSVLVCMPMPKDERRLAVVPAYNEAATVGAVVGGAAPRGAAARRAGDRRRLDGRHRRGRGARRRARRCGCRSTSASAARCRRASRYAREHGYDYMVQVDGDGQHDPARDPAPARGARGRPAARHDLRLALPLRDHATPRRSAAAPGIHLFAFLLSRIVGQRVSDPTSGFRLYNRRAIALFARDYPHDYPEVEAVLMLHHHRLHDARGAGAHVRSAAAACPRSGSGKSVYYMVKVLLALFVGLGRRRARARARRRGAGRPRSTASDGHSGSRSSRSSAPLLLLAARARARAPAARCWSATRCCGCSARLVILGLAVWGGVLDARRRGDRDRLAAERRCSSIAFGFVLLLLLHFSVAVSRLTDQTKVLAQRSALLEERVRRQEERDALATEAAQLERTEA